MSCTTYTRVRQMYEAGNVEEAIEASHVALQNNMPQREIVRLLEIKGIAHHALRQFSEARQCLDGAMQQGALSASGVLALGDCNFALGETEAASDCYRALADDERTPTPLLAALARALSKTGEVERAVLVCRRAAASKPQCHHALFGVAFYMSKAGSDPATILPLIQRVIDMAPGIFAYRMAMMSTLVKMNQQDQAYLAIADASQQELASVRCRCCLNRLITLYKDAGDRQRAGFCISRLDSSSGNCN